MISQLRATTNLRNPSFGFSEDLCSKIHIVVIINYRDPNLTLVEAPVLQPGDVFIDQDQINAMNGELEEAANMELPEGEDENF